MNWTVNVGGANVLKLESVSEYKLIPWTKKVIIFIKLNSDSRLLINFSQPNKSKTKIFSPGNQTQIFTQNNFTHTITQNLDSLIKIVSYLNDYYDSEINFTLNDITNINYINNKSNFVNYKELNNLNFSIIPRSNIIISLTSIPTRVVKSEFIELIDKLYNQILKPKYIVINLCKNYKRKFIYNKEKYLQTIEKIKNTYSNVIINMCEKDYGPATKILGLLDCEKINIADSDRIIVVDDDWFHLPVMTLIYELGYQLYNPDAIFVDEHDNTLWDKNSMIPNDNDYMYYNNYQNMVFGWMTFSFKYEKLLKLKEFYNETIKINPDIWVHDDLIFTLYYKHYKINACAIGSILNILGGSRLVNMNALKNSSSMYKTRCELEKEFFNIFNIKFVTKEKYRLSLINENTLNTNIINILSNLNGEELIAETNNESKVYCKLLNDNLVYLSIQWNLMSKSIVKIYNGEFIYLINFTRKNYSTIQTYLIILTNQSDDNLENKNLISYIVDETKELNVNEHQENEVFENNNFTQTKQEIKFINNKINLDDWNLVDDFLQVYNYKIRELEQPKIFYRYFCYSYINYIREYPICAIKSELANEAVLIEFRPFIHLEFIIRNTILKLQDDWSYTVVCGNLNYDFIVKMCKSISPNIKIIKLDYDNLTQSEYSKLLASEEFWNKFYGEKILIYQEDSCIFKSNINEFMCWDYIGAPWIKTNNDNKLQVGNGGFSLRTKSIMTEIIKRRSIEDTSFNSFTLQYMKNSGQTIGPEDVYFTLSMLDFDIGKVADWDTASKFSSEWIHNPDSLGGHCFWYGDSNWKINLFERIFQFLKK